MARTFCTLEEAATRLNAPKTEVEALLRDGVLCEFRDGSARFLKVADIDALMSRAAGGVALQAPPSVRARTAPSESTEHPTDEIRLPPYASVRVKTRYPQTRPAPPASAKSVSSAGRDLPPREQSARPARLRPSVHAAPSPRPVPPRQTKPQTRDMSLREWIWAGLLDDRPSTLIVLLFVVLVGVCGVTGALYLLMQVLP